MKLQPIYSGENVNPAYRLRYSWTGWPSKTGIEQLPDDQILSSLREPWESDGLRLLEWNWSDRKIQLTFSTTPKVSPVFLAARAKGRLQDALRKAGAPHKFSRKLSVRSVGNNTTAQVENYIKSQVKGESFVDPQFAEKMETLVLVDPTVDLSAPTSSGRGMYWYNLHLVLVVAWNSRIADLDRLMRIRDGASKIAIRKGYGISTLAAMLDHLHVALRADHRQSPLAIALAFQNNLAYLLGEALWTENFYVGTFSEYTMRAVRRVGKATASWGPRSPHEQARGGRDRVMTLAASWGPRSPHEQARGGRDRVWRRRRSATCWWYALLLRHYSFRLNGSST